jgi:hypothetical protein
LLLQPREVAPNELAHLTLKRVCRRLFVVAQFFLRAPIWRCI